MTARVLLFALTVFSAAASGCRIDSLEGADYAGPKNRCAVGCPTGSICVADLCVAEQTNYPVVIDATPPASSRYGAGVTFSVNVDDRRGGTRDLKLPETARVAARLDAGTSLPLVLRLERVGAVAGSASAVFEAKSLDKSLVPTTPPLSVPPGDYHAFVAPANDADLTTVPPVQLRNDDTREPLIVTFPPGAHELRVAYGGTLRKVDVALLDDKGVPLTSPSEARDISVVDLTTGRLASTIAHTCVEPGMPLRSEVTLVLAPELAAHRYSLRVETAESPCSAAAARIRSTLDYDLQALDVEGRGNRATLTMPRLVTTIAKGFVKAFGKRSIPVEGKIILRSVKLDATGDVTGRLSSTVTEPIRDGTFTIEAITGTYHADIIPDADVRTTSSAYAICVDCTVPSQDPMAKPGTRVAEFRVDASRVLDFEVPKRVEIKGSATGFDLALFTVGTWEASTSTSAASLTSAGAPLLTRAHTGNVSVLVDARTGARWNVAGALDPGLYDFVVRTPEASGYPWIVRPRFEVLPQATLDTGTMTASAPVIFTGVVLDPAGNPIPRATVRARALIVGTDATRPPTGAVLVGETRADDAGRYRLVVPSALTAPPKDKT
jgi:hypothetical protein